MTEVDTFFVHYTWNFSVCVLDGHTFVVVLHHIWLTCCVAFGCSLCTTGLSSLGLQAVSVQ